MSVFRAQCDLRQHDGKTTAVHNHRVGFSVPSSPVSGDTRRCLFTCNGQHLVELAGQTCSYPAETGKSEQQSRPLMFDAVVDTEVIRVQGSFCSDSTPSISPRLAPSPLGFRGYVCVCLSPRVTGESGKEEQVKWRRMVSFLFKASFRSSLQLLVD
ncbi:hypothetical protein E2C01_061516 [Portunus trituberculatus]|uniref:Uncharacterized protein n=1 Tax=Portunus trituberculatus TaxID=210409 RepID=A0A5B7H429_PORTR|nr:hypothetical protein [Portunus trituberculatus]